MEAHASGARDYSAPLWTLLMFDAFLRNVMEGDVRGFQREGRRMTVRILHVLDHSIPLQSGYTFRTRAILREQRRMGWETFHLTSPKHTAPGEPGGGGRRAPFLSDAAARGALGRLPVVREIALMLRDGAATRPGRAARSGPISCTPTRRCSMPLPALWVGRRIGIPVVYEVRAFWEDAAAITARAASGDCVTV